MKFQLNDALSIGRFPDFIRVDELEICAVSFNFEPERSRHPEQPHAILSILLVHPATGWKHNVVYQDADALAFWQRLDVTADVSRALLEKLVADRQMPPGKIVEAS